MSLFDSNIWIYSFDISHREKFSTARQLRTKALSRQLPVAICPQNYTESFRALTDPQLFENPFSPAQARRELNKIWEGLARIYPDGETISILDKLIQEHPIRIQGLAIYDAFLVATMLSFGIETIYTDNEVDFNLYKQVKVINPFA